MKPFNEMALHPMSERLVDILCQQTQNYNPEFFRILAAYHFTKIPAMMRVSIFSKDRKNIPINLYCINLASSGQGKGHSTTIIEDRILDKFRSNFMDGTLSLIAEENLARLAVKRAAMKETEEEDELNAVYKEYKEAGEMAFSFDAATTAAVKQLRHKLLMCKAGSINLEIDEIGSNLMGNAEVLSTFLELFDVGNIKQKLTKNTKDNTRGAEIHGKTPANLLLFGTPSKLLNGGKIEEEFYSFLETGYARRCLFGYSLTSKRDIDVSPEDVYNTLIDTSQNSFINELSVKLGKLADPSNYNKVITVPKVISLLFIEYRLLCEKLAAKLGEHAEIQKAELSHRYFKAMKLAGTYAFIDGNSVMTEENAYAAIRLVENSGDAFTKINNREPSYAKLAKYIAQSSVELTQVDLIEKLPFYKGSAAIRNELMINAIAWGYKNQVIIKKSFSNGIEFLSGETLKKTNLNKMILAYSADIATNYADLTPAFTQLHIMSQKVNRNFTNHQFNNGHRISENVKPGFNMVVLDVDGSGISIHDAMLLLKNYAGLYYTTKRHTSTAHRFRIILPILYELKLSVEDFKEFMKNLFTWLPFDVDTAAFDPTRKWATNKGVYAYSKGTELLDPMPFIPRTSRNDERKQMLLDTASMSNLERWFVNNTSDGNRSNQLLRYGLLHVDQDANIADVRKAVCDLNDKLQDKLDIQEIDRTIMVTVAKAIQSKGKP